MNIKKRKILYKRSRNRVTRKDRFGFLHIKIAHWHNDHLSSKEGAPLRSAFIEDHTYSANKAIGQSTDSTMSYGPVNHTNTYEAEDELSKPRERKRNTSGSTGRLSGWRYEDVSLEDELQANMAFHEVEVECGDELSDADTHSSSDSEDYCPDNTTSDSDSVSSSSSSSDDDASMCTKCGKGPFRNLRVHLFKCKSEKWSSVCTLCNQKFLSKLAQSEHYREFFICDSCSEIFHTLGIYQKHSCPKGNMPHFPTITNGCSALMKNKCQFCHSFFCTEDSLSDHLVAAHSTKVTTKVCLIPNQSVLTAKNVPGGTGSTAQPQLAPNNSGLVLVSNSIGSPSPSVVRHVINGKPSVGQGLLGKPICPSPTSQPGSVTSGLENGQTSQFMIFQPIPATQSSVTPPVQLLLKAPSATGGPSDPAPGLAPAATQNGTQSKLLLVSQNVNSASPTQSASPPAPLRMAVPAPEVRAGTGQVANQAPHPVPPSSPTESPPAATPALDIVGMFKNPHGGSAGWRAKTSYPCRQCGATSRQPSIVVAHRYLHRGRRPHRCQCGRAFRHQLHLLRHCVQHAEATRYICVGCGETFTGARLFVKHVKRHSGKKRSNGCSWKERLKGKCTVPFYCDCGQHFVRPSAYIWHQLKNRATAK